jgi:hypothetical protein
VFARVSAQNQAEQVIRGTADIRQTTVESERAE